MAKAWVIRSGRYGERDSWALENGCSGGGWQEVPDLTPYKTREEVARVVAQAFSGAPDGTLANYTGQLWALRGRIEPGDLLVMPLKTTKQIALGRVSGGYEYRVNEDDPNKRHVVPVRWERIDLPRTSVKQDLLFTLGSAMSIFAPSKNQAIARIEHLLGHGTDPGQLPFMGEAGHAAEATSILLVDRDEDVDEPELNTDIEQVAADRITARIAEEFAGHGLATLVTELLIADGFMCVQSPPGPDGGIDILAGRGPLGLDIPRLLVQVKSGGQIGSPVVAQLQGVMATHGADQGLLVAWGGLSKAARDALKTHEFRIRVWEAADVVDALLRSYERLSDDIKSKLPLKRIWMVADGSL
jgi:restriction system protein